MDPDPLLRHPPQIFPNTVLILERGGKEPRRDVAMSAQAEMILKKKREIEAKMLASDEGGKLGGPGRKPITRSISKRW